MIKKGDFVQLDYVGTIISTGQIFDLTDEKEAKKHNIFNPKQKYGPITICVGERQLIQGIDEFLVGKELKEYELDVEPEKAFGNRSAKLIQITSANKFKDKPLYAGARFLIDGNTVTVRSVSGGRVILDFNHPLAGKRLHYKLKLLKIITDKNKQVKAILDKFLPLGSYEFSIKDKELTIKLKKEIKPLEKIIKTTLQRLIKNIDKITFTQLSSNIQ